MLGGGFRVEVEAEGQGLAERLHAIPGVQRVEAAGANRILLFADRDVRPEAAAAVVAAGGRLLRLSVEEPSLEAIYTRYFQKPSQESVMRREGSALHGFGVVTLKEVADHFTSVLVVVLVVLVVATAVGRRASGRSTRSRRSRPKIRSCSCGCSRAADRCRWSRCCRSWCRWSRSGSASTR